jgi:cytochrome P450
MKPIANTNKEVITPTKTKKLGAEEAIKFNPFLPEFHTDPYPIYHRLRSEEPIHRSFIGVWVFTRYADVRAVLRDPRFSSAPIPKQIKEKEQHVGQFDAIAQSSDKWLVFLEPPDHTRLRGLASKAYSAGVVERMRPQIQKIVDELIGKVRNTGFMDIVSDLAYLLPTIVLARILGVPDEDHCQLRRWSNNLGSIFEPLMSLESYGHLNQVAVEFTDYFRSLITERKKRPKEDLISDLLVVRDRGELIGEDEVLYICMALCTGGERNTVNLIGNGILALLRHPDQMEKLKQEPGILPSAVEELMRYDSSAQMIARVATEGVKIGDQTIRAGEHVYLCLGAANRDPAQFRDPDKLDITRSDNHHLALGGGIHYCIGATQTRGQVQIAIKTLVQQLPNLKLHTDKLEWRENFAVRGLKALPVTFTP